ncbi:MAG: hypothetical protein ABI863_09735 [Ginsengibacter sp.]
MQFDPDNPVIKLCTQGMNFEALGQTEKAKQLFQEAWHISSNDFEKFTSAHYLARNQKDPKDELKWNAEALGFGMAIHDESMKGHFSSLYLNVGKSYETLGDTDKAKENYTLAFQFSTYLPANAYGELLKSGIGVALQRLGVYNFRNTILDELINKWCETKELKPLSLVLPSYLGNLGQKDEANKLISALSFLSSTRCLSQEDQSKIDKLISELSVVK